MVQPGVLDRLTVTDTVRLLADLCALNVTNECVAAGGGGECVCADGV